MVVGGQKRKRITMIGSRQCNTCNIKKSIEEFPINKLHRNGKRYAVYKCKKCLSTYRKGRNVKQCPKCDASHYSIISNLCAPCRGYTGKYPCPSCGRRKGSIYAKQCKNCRGNPLLLDCYDLIHWLGMNGKANATLIKERFNWNKNKFTRIKSKLRKLGIKIQVFQYYNEGPNENHEWAGGHKSPDYFISLKELVKLGY